MAGPSNSAGGGGSGAIRAGRAFVEMFLEDNKVYRSLEKLKSQFKSLGSFLAKTGGLVAAAGAAVLAPVAGIFKETIGHFDEINKASDRLGATTEAVSGLGYAAEQSGSNLEELEMSAKFLQKNLSDAANGSKEVNDKFRQLGISANQLADLPLDEQFIAVADAISQVQSPADRTALALDLLGRTGTRMLPLLRSRAGGLKELLEEAQAVGAVISKEDADRATQAGDAISAALTGIKNAIRAVGAAFLPEIQTIKEFTGIIIEGAGQVRQWIADHRQLVMAVTAGAVALVAGGIALAGFGIAVSLVGTGIGVAIGLVKGLVAVVLALTTPLGLVAAGLGALGYLWATQTESGQQFVESTKAGLVELAETARTTFEGIADAVKGGDFGLAFEIALTGIQLEWAKLTRFMTAAWNVFKGVFVDGWHEATTAVSLLMNDFAAGVESVWQQMGTGIGLVFRFMADTALHAIEQVLQAIIKNTPDKLNKGFREALKEVQDARNQFGEGARDDARLQLEQNLADIERERLGIERELIRAHQQEQDARNKARQADMKAAQDDVTRLEKQLRELRQRAADAANKGPNLSGLGAGAAGSILAGVLGALPKPAQLAGAVKGAFATPFASRQFGAGDSVQNRIEKNTAVTAEQAAKTAENVLSLVNAMRFH